MVTFKESIADWLSSINGGDARKDQRGTHLQQSVQSAFPKSARACRSIVVPVTADRCESDSRRNRRVRKTRTVLAASSLWAIVLISPTLVGCSQANPTPPEPTLTAPPTDPLTPPAPGGHVPTGTIILPKGSGPPLLPPQETPPTPPPGPPPIGPPIVKATAKVISDDTERTLILIELKK